MNRWRWGLGFGLMSFVIAAGALPVRAVQDTTAVQHSINGVTPERVTAGDVLTLKGAYFEHEAWRLRVTIDGQEVPAQYVEVVSPTEIQVMLRSDAKAGDRLAFGEYRRTVAVWIDGKSSNEATFVQLNWFAIRQLTVLIPLIVYLLFIAGILLLMGGGLFHSATGNLSLSKILMGVWGFVFSCSYVLLAAIWRDFIPVTQGMLWIMGITSAAAVGAKAIAVKNTPTPLARTRASRLCSEFHPTFGAYRCEIHRCQALLWSLIVMVVFVIKLISTMRLPEIPTLLLVLMGVSGGTYLGFKYPKTYLPPPPRPSASRSGSSPQSQQRRRRPRRPTSSGSGGGGSSSVGSPSRSS